MSADAQATAEFLHWIHDGEHSYPNLCDPSSVCKPGKDGSEALQRASTRKMFNGTLSDFQLTQAKLAQMATTIDSAALLVYRAAWMRDQGRTVTKEAAMAKMAATEGAQQVIDAAVQMFGGLGVKSGEPVEQLYREIRSLRIYEGATEVQQLIIARELLKAAR